MGTVYLQLLRAAFRKGKVPKKLTGHREVKLIVTAAARPSTARVAAFMRLAGWEATPKSLPLMYPFVESFRLGMLAMSHPDFPFNVLGSVLARNTTEVSRAIGTDEALLYTCRIDPGYIKNDKGDIEIRVETTGADATGVVVWRSALTMIVINPKRERGGGAKAGDAQVGSKNGRQREVRFGGWVIEASAAVHSGTWISQPSAVAASRRSTTCSLPRTPNPQPTITTTHTPHRPPCPPSGSS